MRNVFDFKASNIYRIGTCREMKRGKSSDRNVHARGSRQGEHTGRIFPWEVSTAGGLQQWSHPEDAMSGPIKRQKRLILELLENYIHT
jgi:hypothetical protein